jgi:hypothetical protein
MAPPRHSREGGKPFLRPYSDAFWKMGSRIHGNDERLLYGRR